MQDRQKGEGMRRSVAIAGLAVLAVWALGTPAGAKGASEVTIKGVGGPPITFGKGGQATGDPSPGSKLGRFMEASGIFPSLFDTYPDPMLDHPPAKDLGPRYTVTWRFPTGGGDSDFITQYVYPFAPGGPVTYTPSDQTIFEHPVHGGWYVADHDVTTLLKSAGLASPRTTSAAANAAGEVSREGLGASSSWRWVVWLTSLTALGAVGVYVVRRRTGMAAAR